KPRSTWSRRDSSATTVTMTKARPTCSTSSPAFLPEATPSIREARDNEWGQRPMFVKIERDQSRFKQIVRGKVRENLRKYVTHGEMIGRKGRDLVSIPLPQLDVPHFRYGKNGSGGVGQGEGEIGQPIAAGDPDGEGGQGQAGSDAAPHVLEV